MRAKLIFCLFTFCGASVFAETPAAQIEFFENEIRPVLAESCLDCHTGAKAKVGLELDHREGWIKGSDYHKIIKQENPLESLVLHAIRRNGKSKAPTMPEKGDKLSPESITAFEKWIKMGLPWPTESNRKKREDPSKHWSFQPVTRPPVPDGVSHPIDYFIQKKLQEKSIGSSPRADRKTLYRRLSYDLTGLPPEFEESEKFVGNPNPHETAWPKIVDHFLASPHYGERWARHWMDIARYSDTKGYEVGGRERRFVYSYTYRDWLIRAFNDDLPFDQFLLYQLAADQLVEDWAHPDRHHLAAMGFISLSKNGRQELVLDDRLDTTFRGMMGLTVSCARCHDHKFDPISTKEYYGLYGIFKNSMTPQQPTIVDTPDTPAYKAYLKELAAEQKNASDYLAPHLATAKKKFPKLAKNEGALKSKLGREILKKHRELQIKVDKFVANRKMEPAKALVVVDRARRIPQKIFIRGNPSRRGELAPPQFLKVAMTGEPTEFKNGSGRLEMAHKIASPDNPLTARVAVNRIWMWHFGEGIVRTVSDFGMQGEKPDNPELLDWLASWFVENSWSVKRLHRLILTSETWQQSCENPDAQKWTLLDPENRLLWKSFRRRLDFEQLRDSCLTVAGNLDNKMYGRTVEILKPPFSNRRTVYAYIDRQNLPSVFRHFDFSNPQESTGQRQKTTIPMQALFTMNSPFVMNQAANLNKKTESADDRVQALHHAVFAREPSGQDRPLASSFLNAYESGKNDPRQNLSGWSYGWGGIDEASGKVNFKLFRHWDPKSRIWRIKKEYPIKNSKQSYLSIGQTGSQHPGLGADFSVIMRWHAPRKMKINISSEIDRPAVGKGKSGILAKIVSSKNGELFSKRLLVTKRSMSADVAAIEVEPDEIIHFIGDCDKDTSYDSFTWDPTVLNAGNPGERWKMSIDFTGPQTPLTGWEAYTQALLNTNRFLFID